MPARNVNLQPASWTVLQPTKAKAGLYHKASEVVRAGLRALQREERKFEAKLTALRMAVDEGDASGPARQCLRSGAEVS